SIKRVEILSEMQERAPELPEVDAGAMASLQTLGQIVAYMGEQAGNDYAPASGNGGSAHSSLNETAETHATLGRYSLLAVEAPEIGLTMPGLLDGQRVVITDDGQGIAAALVDALGRRGVSARLVAEVPEEAEAVIFLGGLQPAPTAAINQTAFEAARAVASRFASSGGLFVTVQDTGGAFGLTGFPPERAWMAGLAALTRTAAQEWPDASVKAIDLERGRRSPEALAETLASELLHGGPDREVGLRADGQRLILRDHRTETPRGRMLLGSQDVVVVSGGARGVTAASVVALAQATRAKFVLLGRTPLEDEPASCRQAKTDAALKRALLNAARAAGEMPRPAALGRQVRRILANREIRQTLSAIQAAGGHARYVSVDVTDESGMHTALDEVRSAWGPITGIIHGAGVLADKRIADKSPEDFAWVFETKVNGLKAMLHATANDPLKAIVLYSSVAARCGNAGQSDYAMANEVLNKVAEAEARRRGPSCRVRSMGWGPWEGGMVSPQLKARFEALGVVLIPLDAGAQMLVDELREGDDGQVEVTLGGEPRPEALLSDGSVRSLLLEVNVSRATHPYLAAHTIQGTPVLPVVLAVEWFSRAARAFRPDLRLISLSEIQVMRGIRLERFDQGGDLLRLRCQQLSNGDGVVVSLELRGAEGALHYTATGELRAAAPTPIAGAPTPVLEPWSQDRIYDGDVLFHGPDFQVIDEVEGVSDEGIIASMGGLASAGWPREDWQTDAAAFDGGLQLALLWSARILGGASLPTRIGAVRTWAPPPGGKMRCVLTGRRVNKGKAVADMVFLDADGRPFASLQAVETHLLPRPPRR
ncbi:MAG: SDR family NAD(P)-dependent oxidoreductase, partial [Myxococcota bacterium]